MSLVCVSGGRCMLSTACESVGCRSYLEMVGFWLSSEFPQMDLKQWVRKFSNRPTATEFLFAVWWIMRFWNSRVLWGEELWAMKDVQRFIENAILQCFKLQIDSICRVKGVDLTS